MSTDADNDIIQVSKGPFNKEVDIPTSKSYANRLLVWASVSKKPFTILSLPDSTDVLTMLNCLQEVGIKYTRKGNDVTILNSFPECESNFALDEPVILNTGDGGTTNRFLLALLARGKRNYTLFASKGILNRPSDELVNTLQSLGVQIVKNSQMNSEKSDPFWLRVQGPYKINPDENIEIAVESSRSTQFCSALLLALADKQNIQVIPQNIKSSAQYLELTQSLIDQLNSNSNDLKNSYQVPVDCSSLSYPLGLALTHGEVLIKNYFEKDLLQADSIFLDLISDMGGKPEFRSDGLFLKKSESLTPIDIDCSSFPDLVPTLAFVCSYIDGTSYLRNLKVLHYKESDRVKEILKVLELFEVDFSYNSSEMDEVIAITGDSGKKTGPVKLVPPPDHRIIMMGCLFMRKNAGGTILKNALHVNKSFPDFFSIF